MSMQSDCTRPDAQPTPSPSSRTLWRGIRTIATFSVALISFNRDAGDAAAALRYAERLATIVPGNRDLAALIETLRQAAKKPDGP